MGTSRWTTTGSRTRTMCRTARLGRGNKRAMTRWATWRSTWLTGSSRIFPVWMAKGRRCWWGAPARRAPRRQRTICSARGLGASFEASIRAETFRTSRFFFRSEGAAVLVGGTSKAGTEAAADYLFSSGFGGFLRSIDSGGDIPHFEILLSTQNINGNSYYRKIVCFHLLP